MANSEADFKRELKKAAEALGMHAVSTSPEYSKGMPDLYIRSEDGGHWLEAKFERYPVPGYQKGKTSALSSLQSKWIQDEIAAGGTAVWCVCKKMSRDYWEVTIGATPKMCKKNHTLVATRYTGEKWLIQNILGAARGLSNDRRAELENDTSTT